ncbi:hypothetical protein AB1K91_11610 [Terribacillus sp. 179-K 1B1 HS]|uniref:hypothetical protein n=1 Tax=Terribacillus sp. 179-K 1B1 HS TaxID=3142388 RepID=UPI0039A3B71B
MTKAWQRCLREMSSRSLRRKKVEYSVLGNHHTGVKSGKNGYGSIASQGIQIERDTAESCDGPF